MQYYLPRVQGRPQIFVSSENHYVHIGSLTNVQFMKNLYLTYKNHRNSSLVVGFHYIPYLVERGFIISKQYNIATYVLMSNLSKQSSYTQKQWI